MLQFIPQFKENIALVIINGITIITTPFSLDWFYSGIEQFDSFGEKPHLLITLVFLLSTYLSLYNRRVESTEENYAKN